MSIVLIILAVICQYMAYRTAEYWPLVAEAFRFAAIAYLVAWGATI
jgi:hypothetical protein